MDAIPWDAKSAEFAELVGKTLIEIRGKVGDERLDFVCDDGCVYAMYHSQNCCESVSLDSVAGDLADLIGSTILRAEVATNSESHPGGFKAEYEPESFTWTFYKLATRKGWVDLRWFGTSNGYYSESVSFVRLSGPANRRDFTPDEAMAFVRLIGTNADNDAMSDADFRQLVKNSLAA